jgi:hypothetical protein
MKKSIIYLGIFASMCINTSYAKTVELDQQSIGTEVSRTESNSDLNVTSENNLSKPIVNIESEGKLTESIEIISSHYKKTIEEIIKIDQKITDYNEPIYQPLSIEPTIEDYIRLNNQIIDSNSTNEISPINLELIEQSNKVTNNFEFKADEAIKL